MSPSCSWFGIAVGGPGVGSIVGVGETVGDTTVGETVGVTTDGGIDASEQAIAMNHAITKSGIEGRIRLMAATSWWVPLYRLV